MSEVGRPQKRRVGRHGLGTLSAIVILSLLAGVALSGGAVARGNAPSAHPDLLCNGGSWQTTHLMVWASACQAVFEVLYAQNFSSWNASEQYNFSFSIDWIAEFTPSGHIVRLASPLDPFAGTSNATVEGKEVNLTARFHTNVTDASGNWTPDDTWAGTGPQWNVTSAPVGTTELNVVFHLFNAPVNASANATRNASLSVKFDVWIADWPWASPGDLLGLDLSSLGAGGSHFAFNNSARTLAESWNQDNATFASLLFGPQANVTYASSSTVPSTVSETVGLFPAATPAREAVSLITFGGVAGGYVFASYDPWVVFSPSISTTVPPPVGSSGLSPGGVPPWVVVASTIAAAAAGLACAVTYVVRTSALRREGTELVEEMRAAVARAPPPVRPK